MKFLTLDEFLARLSQDERDRLQDARNRSPFGNICATCAYFATPYRRLAGISDKPVGSPAFNAPECRRRAAMRETKDGHSAWPNVHGSDWCGEYLQVVRLTKDA